MGRRGFIEKNKTKLKQDGTGKRKGDNNQVNNKVSKQHMWICNNRLIPFPAR